MLKEHAINPCAIILFSAYHAQLADLALPILHQIVSIIARSFSSTKAFRFSQPHEHDMQFQLVQ